MYSNELNSQQSAIAKHTKGSILVLAPVGTGKTRVLAERVLCAINRGIPPQRILCLTFTNRAAKEMSERLSQYCPNQLCDLTIKTFHGLCTSMLRIEARQLGLPADFVIYDDADCIELVKEVFDLSSDKDAQQLFFNLANCKTVASDRQLSLDYPLEKLYAPLGSNYDAKRAAQYQSVLQKRHALDFADLVFYVRVMLHHEPEISQRWADKFDFVQVDEVQDTHLSEYGIVKHLAANSGNLAMIGDLDQTIYEWRGSEPDKVIEQFKRDFNPAEYSLTWNYRATKTLLNAASGFADSFEHRKTKITPAPDCEVGELIQVHLANNERAEAEWIGRQIQQLAANGKDFVYSRVAILARSHKRTEVVSQMLERMGIPCVTVERFQFFIRQEVKDALAYLRLILNPFDAGSMRRMLLRPSRGIGDATITGVIEEGKKCGFNLTDMASSRTFINGDPFSELLTTYSSSTVVVFDVETTGFSVSKDEVVEIAAIRLFEGKPQAEFHAYIANTVSVGDSEQIHGHSDRFLAEHGRPAKDVFCEFFEFVGSSILVGHNVGFDIKMVTAQAQKAGITAPKLQWEDTLDIANRFIESDRYNLEALAKHLNLAHLPSHKAMDDVRTTIDLLAVLIPLIEHKADYRQALVYRYGEAFEGFAEQIDNWRDASQRLRPSYLLDKLLVESGLYSYYQVEEKHLKNLLHLVRIFQERDEPDLHPDTALRSILEFTALAKNLDQVSQDDNQVPMITVHQSKGLEFDSVFIAGATEGEFPNFFSVRDNKLEEERRLFYVAMTRAKQKLFISAYSRDTRDFQKKTSSFISDIPNLLLRYS
ncbi:UvrD-helicase domain-containing protein [Nostoc sp. CHAB 5784]|uniref:3'-5' exonuclease n=1 Tax=Nostoc mirabile TaxID=2907820 RepID=UPI001E4D7507|nr:3'-5' exonuclease [Nostoc mirabile]MCC5667800.1 UvrD-helicase domain-containing protein [Nostoc mirabile CHAB5784]